MYCSKCGAMIPDDAIACPQCGCATINFRRGGDTQTSYSKPSGTRLEAGCTEQRGHTQKCIIGALLLIYGAYLFVFGCMHAESLPIGMAVVAVLAGAVLLGMGITKHKIGGKRDRSRDDFDD